MARISSSPFTRPSDLLDQIATDASVPLLARLRALADRVGLGLLLLTIASLIVRPADLVSALEGALIYETVATACLIATLPRIRAQLNLLALRRQPVTSFVLLLVPAVMLSHLASGNTYDARVGGLEMVKGCVFYLLVVAQVDSLRRLRATLLCVAGCVAAVAALAILEYHDAIDVPALASISHGIVDPVTGATTVLARLCGSGVFNDPNDFSLVLVVAMIVCGYGLGGRHERRAWIGLVVPLAICGYALVLTHSRGGMMAAVTAAATFVAARIGKRNTLLLAALCAPLILIATLGRQRSVDLADREDTFQMRLELWSESLDVLRAAPVFGIGTGRLVDEIGQVSHNSFLHAYAEMGLVGGTVFFGPFCLLIAALWSATPTDREGARLRACVLAVTAAYAAGLLSLSRCYAVPTQLILALGTACVALVAGRGQRLLPRMGIACVGRTFGAGLLFLTITYLFLRVMLERGS